VKWEKEFAPSYTLCKVLLNPGESLVFEPGALVYYKGDVEVKTQARGGILKGFLRIVAGESLFLNTIVARTPTEVALAPPVPGDLEYIPLNNESYVLQKGAYLAHHGDVDVSVATMGLKGLIAEGGLVWLKASGTGGVWVCAYGGLKKLQVPSGESVVIDNFHFVAVPEKVDWNVRKFGGWKSTVLGGEGLVVEVRGPATVYVQSRILPPFAEVLSKYLPRKD